MQLALIAAIPLLIWIYLLAFRGGFWRISKSASETCSPGALAPRIAAVIPARNEAAIIGDTVDSLLTQDYPAPLQIVVVDDASEDGTAEAVRRVAQRAAKESQLSVITGRPLPPSWTGKLWAMAQGLARAEELAPDYFLLTDADIHHARNSVSSLVEIAEASGYDLVSFMVKLACASLAEKALIPAFVFFFLQLYPPAWIRSAKSKAAGAAGGCILIRAEALRRMGGLAAIRGEIIDDCALARAIKHGGGRIWMGLARETRSTRNYGTFAEIGRMISRTAFSQLRHSISWLAVTAIALFVTYLLPVLLLFTGKLLPSCFGAAAWLLMMACYMPMLRFYRRSPLWSLTLPFVALFYLGATIHSALQYWRRRGGEWKGRVQDVPGK